MKKNPNYRLDQNTIADEAYKIWEENGKPDGHDLEFWIEAEKRLEKRARRIRQRANSSALQQVYDGE
jgi:hypothetical protein